MTHTTVKTTPPPPSDRSFGLVFVGVFSLVGLLPLLQGGTLRWWALGCAALFLLLALLSPQRLHPLNLLWYQFGLFLHQLMTPLIMSVLFFMVVTPTGLLMRLSGKDPLRLKFDKKCSSYWLDRPPGPDPDSMKNQF
ncbi:conserved hypothetical protein [Magnetococcus marinus MC-1]|uniref:SxtJ n=1 Tax=Magnetococcus marinus (strain ATCC BAA-1437 / JCM 17883 / MC-1) TaxID=156889 RepID=A0L5P2_MAGMM|nr:SxtJ family membrane protein [Magnetococcus marinus]ABK43285.1 conserved hypothetical protein [Magnetococcus marinus MC-1]